MRTAVAILAIATMASLANAAPVKLTMEQLKVITAGNPNLNPNGTIDQSNGASGAPGNSFGAPGQTPNPQPGK
jgi:hypothetical protein